MRVVDRIRIPALVVTAADDPFVPRAIFNHSALAANPNIRLVVTKHGGHCGFLGVPADEGDDGYWAERMIVEFSAEQAGVSQSPGDGRGRLRTAGPSLPLRA
jgi:hypothetical protein